MPTNLFFRCHRTMARAWLTAGIMATALILTQGPPVTAQHSPFTAAVMVNNRAVTYYEIEQRVLFLQLLNAPGNLEARAREALIDERLQLQAGLDMGVAATSEEIEQGLIEFAARANLESDEFVQVIESRGVSAETFRDFVTAGVTWRNVLRTRFGPRARVTEEEVDRALTLGGSVGGARVLLAEIVIPVMPTNQQEVRQRITGLSESLDGDIDGFSAAARRFSNASTAQAGGVIGWHSLSSLPQQLRAMVLTLGPGDVTDPVPLGPAIAIFQLRGFEEAGFVTPEVTAVEYATIPLNGGGVGNTLAEVQALRDAVDSCDDLYGARPDGFTRESLLIEDVPKDIAVELARLDEDEMSLSSVHQAGQARQVLMLCGRSTSLPEGGREEAREALFQQRLASYANGYLAELRAEAIITENE
ncbi:MAG: peptidylprolyl isomerase [Rhodobacteraceae bacterium]|nr:peptidylprolyl isomerase [Paracoccaceae bacterium]